MQHNENARTGRPGTRTMMVAGAAGLLAAVLAPVTASADTATAGAATAPATAGGATPCGAGGVFTAAPPTCTWTAAGTDTFTVPAGVTAVSVDLFGAEGGSAAGFVAPNPPNAGAPGGLGGETRATLAVAAGQRLQITVGAAGSSGSSRHGEFARPGGTGHGAGGGGAHGGGGSGGGGSDVRSGEFGPADRILVAGGGGGAGNGGPLLRGGDGGGLVAEPGGQGGGPEGSGVAGGGGTQSAYGFGSPNSALGGPGVAGGDIDPNTGLANPGSGGPGGNGARGGNGGGGGGGGWFGGAGGSGGGNPGNLYGAGGGGGSSFATPVATDPALLPGVNHGDGKAVVSFRYGTSVSLAASSATPLFGHSVTFTATVGAADPAAGTPGGTVTFSDGPTPLATVPLTGGRAVLTTGGLRPGAHAITATYGGEPAFAPSAAPEPAAVTVGFSRPCVTTAHLGPLTVDAGESLCIGPGGSQTGPLTVRSGGALSVSGAEITGPLSADGALAVAICAAKLTGPVTVR
ncbi:Ig-like domain-containing protein [Kitasatospora sp. NBC_00240]|uniref:Ig-like domain-containing protein n=1 Tax=Kitasatospora sp. NBC_00240 TaxID=2903567 RepID=UPI00224D5DE2|nr:Ig-like domain-containing protein [Kitasatospora sp. NBC_00240]MCX5208048.1 Ig-like domain-containing protein [Kitasatospora sp. NBC_00240]